MVVVPSWAGGSNFIIQLTGIGGVSPNTVLLDWPSGWTSNLIRVVDFVKILQTALSFEKVVLLVKGVRSIPGTFGKVHCTIDIWWVIHDRAFLVLLAWLLK